MWKLGKVETCVIFHRELIVAVYAKQVGINVNILYDWKQVRIYSSYFIYEANDLFHSFTNLFVRLGRTEGKK
jgi:hypothetical protein